MVTVKKLVLSILFLVLFSLIVWVGLLYRTYGRATLLYLARSSPDLIWSYTRSMFEVKRNGDQVREVAIKTEGAERPRASLPPTPDQSYIPNMSHAFQRLNNCGPVTSAMAASIYGIQFDQYYAAARLKGGDQDKNVSPHELVKFLQAEGLEVAYRLNGNPEIIESLVASGIPVIVEQWLAKRGTDELVGHYRVVRGYDKTRELFTTNDSFNGADFVIPYSQFDEWWRPFNRTYLVVYQSEQSGLVQTILQTDWDETINLEDTVKIAKQEIQSRGDGYSYFNLGTAYTKLKQFALAKEAYDEALTHTFPPYFLWYEFGPLETYYQVGETNKVFELTDQLLQEAGEVEEARYYRSLAYTKEGKLVEARIEDDKKLVANPGFLPPFK